MVGDVEKMVIVGLVWGATNALMRRGALLWDRKLQAQSRTAAAAAAAAAPGSRGLRRRLFQWIDLLLTWQYSVPFFINLSASAAFFHILGSAPISVAVPVTNATTFAATAVAGMILGEEMRAGTTFFGMAEVAEVEEAPSFKLFGALIVSEHRRAQEEEEGVVAVQRPAADKAARRAAALPCPRCKSEETKFCYFNNYNVNQPRHLCKACRRYWTAGGALRNIPAKATARSGCPRRPRGEVVARAAQG